MTDSVPYMYNSLLSGCPLIGMKQEILNEIETLDQADREIICGALFYTINWFREVFAINGVKAGHILYQGGRRGTVA